DHDFTARRRVLIIRSDIEERSATDLLVMLGQFTGHRNVTGTTRHLGKILERFHETMRTLEYDNRMRESRCLRQLLFALAAFAREKGQNRARVRDNPRGDKRRQRG